LRKLLSPGALAGVSERLGQQGQTRERMGQQGQTREQTNVQNRTNVQTSVQTRSDVRISSEQRTQIRSKITVLSSARISNPTFAIRVGARVPRSVHVAFLSAEIVAIVPQFRGFGYVLVEDEILILDPYTLEIVAIIPA
jgi:Protein of unknown function (DUF1236)